MLPIEVICAEQTPVGQTVGLHHDAVRLGLRFQVAKVRAKELPLMLQSV